MKKTIIFLIVFSFHLLISTKSDQKELKCSGSVGLNKCSKIFSKTFNNNLLEFSSEFSIEVKASLLFVIQVNHSFHTSLQWSFSRTHEKIKKEFPFLAACQDLEEVVSLVSELIENKEWSIGEIGTDLFLFINLRKFKTKLKFKLTLDEIENPDETLRDISKLIIEKSFPLPRKFIENSEILKKDELEMYFDFLDGGFLLNKIELKLLYSGKKNGFRATDFHERCDGIAQTVTFVKTNRDFIIVGYTTVAWGSSGDSQIDENASLSGKFGGKLRFNKISENPYSVEGNPNAGPIFFREPGLKDLYIADECSENFNSYSYFKDSAFLNVTVLHSVGKVLDEVEAGKYQFKVKAIEVYQVESI